MAIQDRLSGNEAVSHAIKQIDPDVMAAFPITPSTEIPQFISQFVANGEMSTVFVPVESEHSAMSACIGAQAAGARSMTATSSCGLALMWEMLYIAASSRLPVTMAVINRALSGPININNDHSDSMGARDSGWLQVYAEDAQEAYDNFFQCVKAAEHKSVQLPVMCCQDGFITSHGVERIELIETEKVKAFVGEYEPEHYLLNPDEPVSMGPYDSPQYYMEHKKAQAMGMENAREVLLEVAKEFEALTGRKYGLIEEYRMEDAELAMVIIGSSAGTAKETCDRLRDAGVKAGVIKIRVFRPFPGEEIACALKNVKAVAIMDKTESFSANGGPLGAEIRAALYGKANDILTVNYIYGIGGRDVTVKDLGSVYDQLADMVKTGKAPDHYRYLALRD
jgi:pyruvate ferredoxin oxidoreductase alpha subunit